MRREVPAALKIDRTGAEWGPRKRPLQDDTHSPSAPRTKIPYPSLRVAASLPFKHIAIEGPIGGVRYWTLGAGPMVADCRLALALAKVAPELRGLGITAMRFSGAYSYRMAKVGRLSLHAYGLAIDVHEVTADGKSYVVAKDFANGLPNGCAEQAPLLNRLACRLSQLRLFQELLTPDSNADHHDHLHIAIARTPS